MLEFLVYNIFVSSEKCFSTDCRYSNGYKLCPSPSSPLYSCKAEFMQSLLSVGKKNLAHWFIFTYILRYIDYILSINNPDFENYQMYPVELEIKDTTKRNTFAFYLDLILSIRRDGQLRTFLYYKHDDLNFHITNFPFLSRNFPPPPVYDVFISHLIRYPRACSSCECFILRADDFHISFSSRDMSGNV